MAHVRNKCKVTDKLPDECDDSLVLHRYIRDIPELRNTRQRRVAEEFVSSGSERNSVSKTSFDRLSTSDYSSSGSSKFTRRSPDTVSPTSPQSPASERSPGNNNDSLTDIEVQNNDEKPWDSDIYVSDDDWEKNAEKEHFESVKGVSLVKDDIHLLLPHTNILDLPNSSFSITSLPSSVLNPEVFISPDTLHYLHISPVVQISPCEQRSMFKDPHLAYLFIPLTHNLDEYFRKHIVCLFSPSSTIINWRRCPPETFSIDETSNYLTIRTVLTGLFTVIYEDQDIRAVEVSKRIRRRIPCKLIAESVPGLKISFPGGSCNSDIVAKVKLFHDVEPRHPDNVQVPGALACPIIKLSPHGEVFNHNVEIELPVPNYNQIKNINPNADIKIYQSQTEEGEPLQWELLIPEKWSIHHHYGGKVTISFLVKHFTFFKLVWDSLSKGVGYFGSRSYPMKCVAFMQEVQEDNTFSLEVLCYNTETNASHQVGTYPHRVGCSLKPKLVKPGNILMKLNSGKFIPNIDAGEEEVLEKIEEDFNGNDFNKQFACIFKQDAKVDKGTFGKVFVDRIDANKTKMESLFEFNLTKQGVEAEEVSQTSNDAWALVAVKELAGNLGIDRDWTKFADQIGLTRTEQEYIQRCGGNPFIEMMKKYQERGGSAEDFVQNCYTTVRTMNVEEAVRNGSIAGSTRSPGSASSSGVSGSGSQNSQDNQKNLSTSFSYLNLLNLNPWRTHEDSDSGTADLHHDTSPAKKLSPTGSRESRKRSFGSFEKPRSIKRQKVDRSLSRLASFSTRNDDLDSSSDESGTEEDHDKKAKTISTQRHLKNPYKLTDSDMWKISDEMSSINWRALGRTLGLDEACLQNLDHSFKINGVRECTYQMMLEWKERKPKTCTFGSLYSGLTTEKMNGIAKNLVKLLEDGHFKKNS